MRLLRSAAIVSFCALIATVTGAPSAGALMGWILNQQYFRENLKLGPGGETGPLNDMLRNTTERIGANIMGKRMFDVGERAWPDEAPFHTPVYVLTHEKREPWFRPGGTTFYFVNDGPESALRAGSGNAADHRDIRIARRRGRDPAILDTSVSSTTWKSPWRRDLRRWETSVREPPLNRAPRFRIDKVLDSPAATHLRYVRD